MKHYYRYLPLLIWSGVIIFGSSRGAVSVSQEQDFDVFIHKLAHITEYAILYLLFIYSSYTTRRNYPSLSLLALLFVFLFGLSDEAHQLFTPTRGPKVSDAFVDLFGGIVGYMLMHFYFKKKE